jgi:hypothetical protein
MRRVLSSVVSVYENLFTGLYECSLRRWGGFSDAASWLSYGAFSSSMWMNTLFFMALWRLLGLPDAPKWSGQTLFVLIYAVNYRHFIYRKRYGMRVARFRKWPSSRQHRWNVLGVAYFVASFGSALAILFVDSIVRG